MPTGVKSNMPNGSPSSSSRTRDTMMLGEVPTRVTMPPSSEPKAIGIRKLEGGVLVRRAIWNATGIIIASAPMFFTKADSTVTTADQHDDLDLRGAQIGADPVQARLEDPGFRHRGADEKRARDDDDDVVAEAREGLVGRHDADQHGRPEGREPRRDRSAAGPRRRAPSSRRRWRRKAFADGSWGTRARGTSILTRRGPVGAFAIARGRAPSSGRSGCWHPRGRGRSCAPGASGDCCCDRARPSSGRWRRRRNPIRPTGSRPNSR